jgi:nucleoside-diphosphate-sugar epimerase
MQIDAPKRSILVTGAGGYIGRHVCAALLRSGVEVLAVDPKGHPPTAGLRSIDADFGDISSAWWENGPRPAACIHLAWSDGFDHNAQSHINNIPKHAGFTSQVLALGIGQFVGMGSMHEIGYFEGQLQEDTPARPRSKYGIAKNALRDFTRLETAKHGTTFQWLRGFYILGDDQQSQSLFSKILTWEQQGMETFPFNSGKNQYDFISIERLSRQIALAALQTEVTGIIDCCTGRPTALKDQVASFISEHGLKIRPKYGAFPDRDYDSPAIWGNPEKINRIEAAFEKATQLGSQEVA